MKNASETFFSREQCSVRQKCIYARTAVLIDLLTRYERLD